MKKTLIALILLVLCITQNSFGAATPSYWSRVRSYIPTIFRNFNWGTTVKPLASTPFPPSPKQPMAQPFSTSSLPSGTIAKVPIVKPQLLQMPAIGRGSQLMRHFSTGGTPKVSWASKFSGSPQRIWTAFKAGSKTETATTLKDYAFLLVLLSPILFYKILLQNAQQDTEKESTEASSLQPQKLSADFKHIISEIAMGSPYIWHTDAADKERVNIDKMMNAYRSFYMDLFLHGYDINALLQKNKFKENILDMLRLEIDHPRTIEKTNSQFIQNLLHLSIVDAAKISEIIPISNNLRFNLLTHSEEVKQFFSEYDEGKIDTDTALQSILSKIL